MRNAYRLSMQITSGIATVAAAFEAATRNWRCAAYAACCAILFRLLIRDDIFIEKISNETKRMIKGDKQ